MRGPPVDLATGQLLRSLAGGWRIRAAALEYLPIGGGSYHWRLTDEDGRPHFITVDDLDAKDWIGRDRQVVFEGLGRALSTAAALRHDAGLEFVVAPLENGDGELLRRLDDRYTVSVFPFLTGRSHPFGPYPDARLRDEALDLIAALHKSTAAVGDGAPRHVPSFSGRCEMDAFLLDPGRPWDGGPYSAAAHDLLVPHAASLAELTKEFDRLVASTRTARADHVITHGEPHPANLMSAGGRLYLIDWDTAALAPAERDLALIVTSTDEGVGGHQINRYQEATGRGVELTLITLYRVRWYLDDLGSAIRLFGNRHSDRTDTRRWWQGLPPQLEQLPSWLRLMG